jgi:integrator complex subunit 9
MVEHFLSSVTHVVNRNGVCVIPCSPCGVVFDLVETIYAYLHAHKRQVPMYLVGSHVQEIIHLAEVGAEWVAEKKVEKLYCGESAFIHGGLIKNKLLHVVPQITSSMAATMQNGSIVFVTHPSLRFGEVMNLMHRFGHSSQNALIFIDPLFNPSQIIVPFQHFEIERIYCIIDSRLTCGDANQLIARCAPKQLLIPEEFTMEPPNHPPTGSGVPHGTSSHLSHVLQLNELIAPRPKIELQTFAMRHMEPISIDRSSKYVDGLLDIKVNNKYMLKKLNPNVVLLLSSLQKKYS